MQLDGKVALITGASGGMGAAIARRFSAEGALVVVTDLLDAEGKGVAADIGGLYRHHDVSDEASWADVVSSVQTEVGDIDILVNNAGLSGAVGDNIFDVAEFDKLMAVNARGAFLGMAAVVPSMVIAGTAGSIVNMSSISALTGQYGLHVGYNASKAAVRLMTKAAAVNYGKDGIRVNSVHPGIMPAMRSAKRMGDPAVRQRLLDHIPMAREGRIDEVANAVLFLASDQSSYITGAELHVDGGFSAY